MLNSLCCVKLDYPSGVLEVLDFSLEILKIHSNKLELKSMDF